MNLLSRRNRDQNPTSSSRKRKSFFRQTNHRQGKLTSTGDRRFYKKCVGLEDNYIATPIEERIYSKEDSDTKYTYARIKEKESMNNCNFMAVSKTTKDVETETNLSSTKQKESDPSIEYAERILQPVSSQSKIQSDHVNLWQKEKPGMSDYREVSSDRQLQDILLGLHMAKRRIDLGSDRDSLHYDHFTKVKPKLIDEPTMMERSRNVLNDDCPHLILGEEATESKDNIGNENVDPSPVRRYEMTETNKDAKVFLSLKQERRRRKNSASPRNQPSTIDTPQQTQQIRKLRDNRNGGGGRRAECEADRRVLSELEVNVYSDHSVSSCSMDSAFQPAYHSKIPLPPPPPPPRKKDKHGRHRNNFSTPHTHNNLSSCSSDVTDKSGDEFNCHGNERSLEEMAKATFGFMDDVINTLLGKCSSDDEHL